VGNGQLDEEDDVAVESAMLSEEEALVVTNRLHQVPMPPAPPAPTACINHLHQPPDGLHQPPAPTT
jgi:hypothetical protein